MSMHTRAAIATVLTQAAALAAAHAQQAADRPTAEVLQEIVVTGSLIKRAVGDVAQPVTTLRAEELISSGATNAEQIMQQIAQNQSLNVSNINIGANTGGAAYANLRALGSARTLVLVDGKRVVNNPFQTIGVDLNTLPTALIERVEVLTDGGSATYGTDAIAGVMNFITLRELNGLNLSATASLPEASGGGEMYLVSAAGGIGSLEADGWNAYVGVSWREAHELPNTARDFSSSGFVPERGVNRLNTTTFPASYTQTASGISNVNPTNPACSPPFSLFGNGIFGPRSCGYDQLAHIMMVTPQEQWSGLGKASVRIGERHTASVEYIRAENEVFSIISPQGIAGLTMTTANPYYPGQGITPGTAGLNPALPIVFNLRTEAMGKRENTFEGFTDRAVVQLEGEVLGWDYQLSGLSSNSEVDVIFTNGYPDEFMLRDGFTGANGAPFLNPFGPQTAAGQAYFDQIEVVGEVQHAEGELRQYSLQFNRDLFELPAGPFAVAVAFEYKEDEAEFRTNADLARRVPTVIAIRPDIVANRHAASAAVETNIPVLESLELGISVRYDDYSDFGDTTNPEFSVRYEPFDALVLRGSYSTGFRAPTLYDVFQPTTLVGTISRFNDPVLCPGGTPNAAAGGVASRDCNIQFGRFIGGNHDLDPEESEALSVGFMLRPLADLSFGVDYWEYHVEQTISPLSEQAIFADPVKYADLFVRCSALSPAEQAAHSGCIVGGTGDPLAYITNVVQNLGDTKTSGFDGTAEWTAPDTAFGRFGVRYRGTYVLEYDFQREPGGQFFSRAGQYFDQFPVIRYIHFLTLSWERGQWYAGLTHRYKSSYTDCNAQCLVTPAFFNEVDADSVFDLSGTWRKFDDKLLLSVTIQNLLDEEPPFSNKNIGVSANFDDRFADGRLRTYLLTATYKF